jgi:chemotaxis protein MotB
MSRRKKHATHANHERWLVSYADFITLLFAFFVVMFASSQVDKRKVGKIALAIQVAFQSMGIFEASNTRAALAASEPMPFSNVQMVENAARTEALGRVVSSPTGGPIPAGSNPAQSQMQAELERVLSHEINRGLVNVRRTREGLVISLQEVGFFDSGSATLRPGADEVLARIANILRNRPESLRVEGHTDDVPIHNANFASNWELSTARATRIVELLISRYGVSPWRLSAAGYAEYRPVATNTTPEGRALNRRVDIVVLAPAALPSADSPGSLATHHSPPPHS